jgi:hypothetical protein
LPHAGCDIVPDPPDDVDEVALNVLLAEGFDLPTALEASRRDYATNPSQTGCLGVTAMILTVVGVVVLCL